MKISNLVIAILLLTILTACSNKKDEDKHLINPIIGDISYIETFGHKPSNETGENLRIQTHLLYVEKLLRNKNITSLSTEIKQNRNKILDLLKEYALAGAFPKNHDYKDQRRPCFIDKEGNICAVGYLVEKTVGRNAAELINSKFKYDYILSMNDPIVDNWIENSGFSKKKIAMIQPSYGPDPTDNYVSTGFSLSTSLASGLNISLNTINGIQIAKGTTNKTASILGLISGAGQITLGVLNYPRNEYYYGYVVRKSQRDYSLINIGIGTSTLILSSWNLITNRKPKEKKYSWNLYNFQTPVSNLGFGLSFIKKI